MKNFRTFSNTIFIRPEKSITHWVTSILIFSFVMMPFVHFHPTMQHFDKEGIHLQKGKVDFLSFSDDSATAGEQGIAREIVETPEIKHLFEIKRSKKIDFFLAKTTFTHVSPVEETTFISYGNSSPVLRKNHYHFPSSLSPPVSLA